MASENENTTITDIETVKEKKIESRLHESWIDAYISYTNFNESPVIFHKWMAITVLAGTLSRNVYIQRGYGRLYPNLYVVLVSPTGKSKKTSAANIGINNFLQKIDGIRIARDESTPKGLVQFLSMSPTSRNGSKITQNCTAYIYAPELSDLLGEQSYNLGLIKKLTSLYDSPDVYNDMTKEILVKKNEPTILTNVCLNMCGCSNPEWLAAGLREDSFGGGFMGRTLFIYSSETRKTKRSAWMEVPSDIQLSELTLLRDLQRISKLHGAFNIQQDAYEYFQEVYIAYTGDFSGRMAGYLERKLTYALKLAMILSVNESDSMNITAAHIKTAIAYLDEIEVNMPSAFVYINATEQAKISQHIIECIKEHRGAIHRSVLVSKFRHSVRNIKEFDDVLQMLTESRVLKQVWRDEQVIYIFSELHDELTQQLKKTILDEDNTETVQ